MRRWFAVLVACLGLAGPALADDKVIVFAAASLKTATASTRWWACTFRLSAAAALSSTNAAFCCVALSI